LQDAVKISSGGQAGLPVLHYTARQTFATSGTLDQEGSRLELVSLPRLFDPVGGELRLSLSPSIGGAMLQALDVLDMYPYDCNEQALSRFLPNLEAYRALQTFGIESQDLRERLDRNIQDGLNRLIARQNPDGGWGWWPGGESDSYITSYILFGLSRARLAGISVVDPAVQKAIAFLNSGLPSPQMGMKPWELDRLAFELFALQQAGSGSPGNLSALYEVRDQLDPWAKALLALTLDQSTPGDPGANALLSDVQSTAIRSATGAHWEDQQPGWQNMDTTITVSAIVVYALALHEPASTLLPDAVRFLMSNQQANGAWSSTYETAWTLMAMTEFMKGTGELNGNFSYSALLNGAPFASGQVQNPGTDINPVVASAPLNNLFPEDPNALEIKRGAGPGRLYYNAYLSVYQPVEKAAPLNQGVEISRSYFPLGSACPEGSCAAVHSAKVGDLLNGVITLVLPNDAYHFIVEDYIPAGTELLDTSLKTAQQGAEPQNSLNYNPEKPFDQGWGWWLFHPSQIYDDHIAWAADHLPAGTYQLKYTLVVLQPGQYRVLPAHAWQFYFPEVQGNSAGAVFDIQPEK
ncbi:MAG: prenyltransferase/squalene oxidase repeat-containing protein, partial [Omnitrophica WOR_2 bacterium]